MTLLPPLSRSSPFMRRIALIKCLTSVVAIGVLGILCSQALVFRSLFQTGIALAAFSALSGVLAFVKHSASLMWSLILASTSSYGFLIIGSVTFCFLPHLRAELATQVEIQYMNLQHDAIHIDQEYEKMKMLMIVSGVVCCLMGVFALFIGRAQYQNLGEKRGAIALLQTFSLTALPIALMFLIGSSVVLDGQTLAASPYTSLFLLCSGLLALGLAILAFVGATFEYRRLLSYFRWGCFLTAMSFLSGGLLCFVMEAGVKTYIIENWDNIRLILPPNFVAKYDQSQFVSLIQTHMSAFAVASIITGLFLVAQHSAAGALYDVTDVSKKQLEEDHKFAQSVSKKKAGEEFDPAEFSSHPHFAMRRMWHFHFLESQQKQRRCLRYGCLLGSVFFLTLIGIVITSVVFTTKCNSLTKATKDQVFPLIPTESTIKKPLQTYIFTTYYTHGHLQFHQKALSKEFKSQASKGLVQLHLAALNEKYTDPTVVYKEDADAHSIAYDFLPRPSNSFLWIETSCQSAEIDIHLPVSGNAAPLHVEIISNSSVNYRMQSSSERLSRLAIQTIHGNINLTDSHLGDKGLTLQSFSGKLEALNVGVDSSATPQTPAPVRFESVYGEIQAFNVSLKDCSCVMRSQVGQIILNRLQTIASSGWKDVDVHATAGGIYASFVDSNWIKFRTIQGNIQATNLEAKANTAMLGRISVESTSGNIELWNTFVDGYLHVESHTGDIKVHLKSYSFKGLFYVRSSKGSVTVRKGKASYDQLLFFQNFTTTTLEARGSINCGGQDSVCYDVGDLHVLSHSGNILLIIGCEDDDCES